MQVVGLTGGIGSGKSTLAAAMAERGVPVIDVDALARDCVRPGSPVLAAIVERFGREVLAEDGALDRAGLAAVVFADPAARADLEALTHPCVRAALEGELTRMRTSAEPPPVVVVDHPLLVESGATADVDLVVVVEAPLPMRIERLARDRGMPEAQARARIAAQADDAARRAAADVVVVNDADRAALVTQAATLVDRLRAHSGAER